MVFQIGSWLWDRMDTQNFPGGMLVETTPVERRLRKQGEAERGRVIQSQQRLASLHRKPCSLGGPSKLTQAGTKGPGTCAYQLA